MIPNQASPPSNEHANIGGTGFKPVPAQIKVASVAALDHLPEVAWRGLAGRYRNLLAPATEAPDAFHLAGLIAAVGCLIGRKAWICTPQPTYPNAYCLLVGKTGHTRKSTAYQFALNLLADASELLGSKSKRLNGLASVEGLAAAMRDKDGTEPFRILCVEDEFKSLITKSGQRAVSNIIPRITELYNCPNTFEVNTRKDAILVQEPFLCMLAASTRAWFEESLTGNDVSGGFLNRWLLFEGESEMCLPFPHEIEKNAWDDLVLDVTDVVDRARGRYAFSPQAKQLYERFYRLRRTRYGSEASARVDLHAKKLGLFYAILAGHTKIEREDIESGIAVAEYCARIAEPLAARLDRSPQRRIEDRFLEMLEKGPIRPRDAYRALHVSAGDLRRAAQHLEEIEQIRQRGGVYTLVA